ncbi:hypothetical protein J6590_077141 [Homalodisca vitripennis]|nr:hypothetical protein J6590_077141 [Homalodisca vitripennis]
MEFVPGERFLINQKDGYLYRNKLFRNGTRYVQYRIEGCGSAATFLEEAAAEIRPSPHNHLPDEVQIEVVQGERFLINHKDGYRYRKKLFRKGTRYVQYRIECCRSTATFREEAAAEIRPSPHKHPPDEVQIQVLQLKAEFKQRTSHERRLASQKSGSGSGRQPRRCITATVGEDGGRVAEKVDQS